MTMRVSSLLLLAICMGLGPMPGTSEADDHGGSSKAVVLYELNERARFTADNHRIAKSGIGGKVRRGNPLCPEGLMAYAEAVFATFGITVKDASRCGVVAFGHSDLDLGAWVPHGTIHGEFSVVVNSDATNLADSAELEVMAGTFEGTIKVFDPDGVIIDIVSPSTFKPEWILDGFPGGLPPPAAFTGKFRLPFRAHHRAVYKSDRGRLLPILPNERALGDATVRVEVTFD